MFSKLFDKIVSNVLKQIIDAPLFNLVGKEIPVKCVDVYDGDTVTILFNWRCKIFKKKLRLSNIDTAEIRTKDAEEKKFGLKAKDFVSDKILDKIIWIKCEDWDKYGRLLGYIFLTRDDLKNNTNSLNDTIIKKNLGYEYCGNKKRKFEDWKENKFNY